VALGELAARQLPVMPMPAQNRWVMPKMLASWRLQAARVHSVASIYIGTVKKGCGMVRAGVVME